MFARNDSPATAAVPALARLPRRAAGSRATGLAAGLALLASVAGPMVPSAAAFTFPPQLEPKLQSPLSGRQLEIRLPDLQVDGSVTVRWPSFGSVAVARGDTLGVAAPVRNTGSAGAGESVTRFDLVWEQIEGGPSSGDPGGSLTFTLGDVPIPGIAAGSVYFPFIEGGAWYFTVPANTRTGIYRVRACADATQVVTESSNANNCRLSDHRVGVG